jgi:signal recognition particle subunit SEC65
MGKSKKGGVRIKQVGGGSGAGKMPPSMLTPEDLQNMMHPSADIEQQHRELLPPPIDRNFKMIWPLHETFTMKHIDRFYIMYPNYMDGQKSTVHGRKIAKTKAVSHDGYCPPNVSDISSVLQELRIRHVIEAYKGYSKDASCHFEQLGRVRYDPDFTLPDDIDMNDENQTPGSSWRKRRLLELVAARIPLLPSRIERVQRETAERARRAAERAAAVPPPSQKQSALATNTSSSAGTGGNAKKNKGNNKKGKRKV